MPGKKMIRPNEAVAAVLNNMRKYGDTGIKDGSRTLEQIAMYAAAEDTFFPAGPKTPTDNPFRRAMKRDWNFKNYGEAQAYLDSVLADPYTVAKFGELGHITIVQPDFFNQIFSGGGAYTDVHTHEIALPEDGMGMSKETVLHEMSHQIQHDKKLGVGEDGHGFAFAQINATLVDHFMPEKAQQFRERLQYYGLMEASK